MHNDPFPAHAFTELAKVEGNHWWFQGRNRILLWVMAQEQPLFRNFLEIGCGTGFVLEGVSHTFPEVELFGSEYFEEGLAHARQRVPSATFTQLDATLMDEVSRYDAIGAFDVIEHIQEDEKVLHNLARALVPNGRLFITVPQHRWLWSEADEYACHVRRYTKEELVKKIKQAGLKVDYSTSFVSLLIPLMWLSRLQAKKGNYDPLDEFRIPGWLNRSLKAIMSIEFFMIKRGLRLPCGGSLLVVAKKA